MDLAGVSPIGVRGQMITLLLADLRENRGAHRKQDVLGRFLENRWIVIEPEDRLPYPSAATHEARWKVMVAWARQDCVDCGLMTNDAPDSWEATGKGINSVVELRQAYQSGELDVGSCFFWQKVFKIYMDDSYESSETDSRRPKHVYRDNMPPWIRSSRGSRLSRLVEDSPELQKLLEEYRTDGGGDS